MPILRSQLNRCSGISNGFIGLGIPVLQKGLPGPHSLPDNLHGDLISFSVIADHNHSVSLGLKGAIPVIKQRAFCPELPLHRSISNVINGIFFIIGDQHSCKPGCGKNALCNIPPTGRGDEVWLLCVQPFPGNGNTDFLHPHTDLGYLHYPQPGLPVGGNRN